MFKKYLIDNEARDYINGVNLYHEIDVYHKTDTKPKTKKDIQVGYQFGYLMGPVVYPFNFSSIQASPHIIFVLLAELLVSTHICIHSVSIVSKCIHCIAPVIFRQSHWDLDRILLSTCYNYTHPCLELR